MSLLPDFEIRFCTVASAVLWLKGSIHDTALDLSRPEIAFWNELGDLASYRPAILALIAAQPPAMIVHACNSIVWRKLEKEGAIWTVEEELSWRGHCFTARRFLVPPASFSRWLGKMAKNSAAASGVTNSR